MWYLATFRDPWAMGNLFIGVRGKGRQSVRTKKTTAATPGCIIIFSTSAPSAVYSSGQPLIFFRAADLLHLIQVCTMHSSDIYLYQVPWNGLVAFTFHNAHCYYMWFAYFLGAFKAINVASSLAQLDLLPSVSGIFCPRHMKCTCNYWIRLNIQTGVQNN